MQLHLFQKSHTKQLQEPDENIRTFNEFPYKDYPYRKRNWGHGYHFLCSYQSKLKPAIAHFLVKFFTEKGDVVLDPFSGAGTIPLEACLQGRVGIGIDINPVAYHNTHAKVNKPDETEAWKVVNELESFIQGYELTDNDRRQVLISKINGLLTDYYEKRTFQEILKSRKFFQQIPYNNGSAYSFVLACLLHILHGNRPYALSRRSHGLTPFSPTGEFVYKPLVKLLKNKIRRSLYHKLPEEYERGKAYYGSIFKFSDLTSGVNHIITSPPFINSTRFYLNNWIRLWFCGWTDGDFKLCKRTDFLEQLQAKDIAIYKKVFEKFSHLLKSDGQCIMHLGVVRNRDMGVEIVPHAEKAGFTMIDLLYENVEGCESHGLTDQGITSKHSFLFLKKEK
jgi:hypothetical protein